MANAGLSVAAGGVSGVGSFAYFNAELCKDPAGFKLNVEQCSAAFGDFAAWAGANPETAALVIGFVGFGITQGAQMLVANFVDSQASP